MEQVTETPELGLEKIINEQLVKENITDKVIAELKEKYLPLKLKDLDDRDGYEEIVAARKVCKNMRVITSKLCKAGREEANKIQKAWIAKEKELVDKISLVEDHLETQEKQYEAEKERQKEERARRVEEQYLNRVSQLTRMGAMVSEGMFILNTVSHSITEIREVDDDVFTELILPKFTSEYNKLEADRLEQDRIKKEEEERLRVEREKFEQEKREFEQKQAELKKQQEQLEQRQREEQEKERVRQEAELQKRFEDRAQVLIGMGMLYAFKYRQFQFDDIIIDGDLVDKSDEEEWTALVEKYTPIIQKKSEEIANNIKRQKEAKDWHYMLERIEVNSYSVDALMKMTDEEFRAIYESRRAVWDKAQKEKYEAEMEQQRKEEAQRREEELQSKSDKEKWVSLRVSLQTVTERFAFKSPHYNNKFNSLKKLLEEI